jgi:hypothetical protein
MSDRRRFLAKGGAALAAAAATSAANTPIVLLPNAGGQRPEVEQREAPVRCTAELGGSISACSRERKYTIGLGRQP